jgi:hypothetical protein|tara:strand:+ start:63 stop:404 length:342 start_codon:yes stop_codon:yes gene_type:complete
LTKRGDTEFVALYSWDESLTAKTGEKYGVTPLLECCVEQMLEKCQDTMAAGTGTGDPTQHSITKLMVEHSKHAVRVVKLLMDSQSEGLGIGGLIATFYLFHLEYFSCFLHNPI